jgi:hypothetical protein
MSAALYHLHASIGSRAKGASAGTRYEYLEREGIFAEPGRCAEDFVATLSGNMPAWAEADPGLYWRMADLHERDKAVLFREVEFAIPHGIPEGERLQWAEKMARAIATTKDGRHPYTLALHAGKDGANWNAHVIVSERVNDGISRDPEKWFSRAAVASRKTGELDPAKGGARKTREMQPTSWLLAQRKNWEQIGNQALAKAGREERLDCRSYKERGIEKIPQIHLGRKAHQMMQRGAPCDRVATYQEIAKANELVEKERRSAAKLARTTARIEAAVADRKATAAEVARAAEIEKQQAARAGEVEKFIRVHAKDFTTRPSAERWFQQRLEVLSTYNETEYTARGLFESQYMPEDARYRIGTGIENAKSDIKHWTKEAAGIEKQISKHKDPRSFMQRLKGEPDQALANLQASKNDALTQAKIRTDRLKGLEDKWQRERPAWEQKANDANAERIATNERRRDEWMKLYDVRDDVLETLGRRDQERGQERMAQFISSAEKGGYKWAEQNAFASTAYSKPEEAREMLESCRMMYALYPDERVRKAFQDGAAYAVIDYGKRDEYPDWRIADAVRKATGIAGKRFNDLMRERAKSLLRQGRARTAAAVEDNRRPRTLIYQLLLFRRGSFPVRTKVVGR